HARKTETTMSSPSVTTGQDLGENMGTEQPLAELDAAHAREAHEDDAAHPRERQRHRAEDGLGGREIDREREHRESGTRAGEQVPVPEERVAQDARLEAAHRKDEEERVGAEAREDEGADDLLIEAGVHKRVVHDEEEDARHGTDAEDEEAELGIEE